MHQLYGRKVYGSIYDSFVGAIYPSSVEPCHMHMKKHPYLSHTKTIVNVLNWDSCLEMIFAHYYTFFLSSLTNYRRYISSILVCSLYIHICMHIFT